MIARVRVGIAARDCRLTVLRNYNHDGHGFDNAVLIGPLPAARSAPARLFGLQWNLEATAKRRLTASDGDWATANVERRIATVEAMASFLIDRSRATEDAAKRLLGRLVAVTRPQQYPLDDKRPNWTRGDALISYLLKPYDGWLGRSLTIVSEIGVLAADVAPLIAIALHECTRIARAMAPARDGTPDVVVMLDDDLLDGTPAMRFVWRATWYQVAAEKRIDGLVQDTLFEDAFALVEQLATLAGGTFDHVAERNGFVAELTVLNRPMARAIATIHTADVDGNTASSQTSSILRRSPRAVGIRAR